MNENDNAVWNQVSLAVKAECARRLLASFEEHKIGGILVPTPVERRCLIQKYARGMLSQEECLDIIVEYPKYDLLWELFRAFMSAREFCDFYKRHDLDPRAPIHLRNVEEISQIPLLLSKYRHVAMKMTGNCNMTTQNVYQNSTDPYLLYTLTGGALLRIDVDADAGLLEFLSKHVVNVEAIIPSANLELMELAIRDQELDDKENHESEKHGSLDPIGYFKPRLRQRKRLKS